MAEQHRPAGALPETLTLGDDFLPVDVEQWRAEAERSLGGKPISTLETTTLEGILRRPLYAAEARIEAQAPGVAPFTRGSSPLGQSRGGWSVCGHIAETDAAACAEQVRDALSQGTDSLLLILDSGSCPGCDDRQAGLRAETSAELEILLEAAASASALHLASGTALAQTAAVLAAAKASGRDLGGLAGSLGNDPLAALAAEGELAGGVDTTLVQMADLAAWVGEHAPRLDPISVSSLPYHRASATAVQELAFTLATGVEYLRCAEECGLAVEGTLAGMTATVAVGRDFFLEIAKLRALRQLWSQLAQACGESDGAALRILALTSERTQTARDPWVNLLRGTAQVAAAAMGGAETIVCLPFDQPLGRPDGLARRMAVNTQSILREESHVHRLVDPTGGSWYVEQLSAELARAAWSLFQSIEARGGMRACLLSGHIATLVGVALDRRQRAVARRKEPITGVSSFPNLDEELPQRADDSIPVDTTRRTTAETAAQARKALTTLTNAVAAGRGDGSVTAAAVASFLAGATMTQVSAALAADRPPQRIAPLVIHRDSEPFEALREASDRHLTSSGARPRVFLATMGPVAEHKARATFTQNLVEAGGIEAVVGEGFDTVQSACEAFVASGARLAAICSSDQRYQELAAPLAEALKTAGAAAVILAGRPGEHETRWRAAGVDHFVFMGCDVLGTLERLHLEAGVGHE